MRLSITSLLLASVAVAQESNVYSGKADGLSQHTIYMPATKGKVPVLVWSSGGCIRDGEHVSMTSIGNANAA